MLAAAPPDQRAALQELRETIAAAAPFFGLLPPVGRLDALAFLPEALVIALAVFCFLSPCFISVLNERSYSR